MPNNKKKKKANRRDRNEKATSCHGCSRQLDKDGFLHCICTQVRFCSTSCQENHPHNNCPGPPKAEFDMAQTLAAIPQEARRSEDVARRQTAENDRTVRNPMIAYIMSKGLNHLQGVDFSAWDYAAMADEGDRPGNAACAYLAGTQFRHRILGAPQLKGIRGGNLVGKIREDQNIPVLESEELAFKYFEKAARLGHGLAMQSLATCFDDGVGCRRNRRRCNQVLWRACLQNSAGAIELLDSRALLPLEVNSNVQSLDMALHHLQPGQQMRMGGPNLASLLLAFSDVVESEEYSLPPFAGTWATATVNNPVKTPTIDQPRTPLIGAKKVKDMLKKKRFLSQRGNEITFGYCRRGAAKQATLQTQASAVRDVDNQIFFVPPFAACDERVSDEIVHKWRQQCRELYYHDKNTTISSVVCVHNEKDSQRRGPYCIECEADAIERLDSISKGSVVLSLDEELSQRGQAAFYFDRNGKFKTETWKTYAGGEAECVLAILAASGLSPYVAPLFIAQDPNFLWPLIADHGCIRAALEFVAPHIDWNETIGSIKVNDHDQVPILPNTRPGKYLRRCGNSYCYNLEEYSSQGFSECSACKRRCYCSKKCQRADWAVHKKECGSHTNEESNPRLDELAIGLVGQKSVDLKHQPRLEEGEDCVVHGLRAQPHYNGMVGIVGHTAGSGRISVALRSDPKTVLAVKPTNLHCIEVFCSTETKKYKVFECAHGLDVCEECYLDFSTINRLAELKHKCREMTSAAIEQVNINYFSSLSSFDHDEERVGVCGDQGWPIECTGMEQHPKQRFILKALLQVEKQMSLHAEVAKTAMITYGGAFTSPLLRADTKLANVAKIL